MKRPQKVELELRTYRLDNAATPGYVSKLEQIADKYHEVKDYCYAELDMISNSDDLDAKLEGLFKILSEH